MKRCVLILSVCILLPVSLCSAQLFTADMTDSTGWTYSHFGGDQLPTAADSASVMWDWDYSALGIPEAPNSDMGGTATRGLRLAANVDGTYDDDAVAAVFEAPSITGQYTVVVDMWMNFDATGGSATTEHAGLYVGFDSTDVNNLVTPGQNGAGIIMSGDGGCLNCDYILTKDKAELDTFSGQYGEMDLGFGNQPGYDNTDAAGDLDLPAFLPGFDIGAATGE